MAGRMRRVVWGLLGGLLGWAVCGTALAQNAPARPEPVPAPPPNGLARQASAQPRYGPGQAGQDAYRMAEAERRWAVHRQLQLVQTAWWYSPWVAPYVPGTPPVYAYRPRRASRRWGIDVPRRMRGRAYRYGYPAVYAPWPSVAINVYRYSSYPWVRQPLGHETVWIGPNSYVYRPFYERSDRPREGAAPGKRPPSTGASPSTRPEQPTGTVPPRKRSTGPMLKPLIGSGPEPIPTPPAESGPDGS